MSKDITDLQNRNNYCAYDLALAKTVGAPDLATGEATFTITIQNQGSVPSGDYTVTDVAPDGLSFVTADPVATTEDGATLTWDLDGLDHRRQPGQRPFGCLRGHGHAGAGARRRDPRPWRRHGQWW